MRISDWSSDVCSSDLHPRGDTSAFATLEFWTELAAEAGKRGGGDDPGDCRCRGRLGPLCRGGATVGLGSQSRRVGEERVSTVIICGSADDSKRNIRHDVEHIALTRSYSLHTAT